MMDLVLKLRELRRWRGLNQRDAARLSGVGEKTISSFETGQRIGSLKITQLQRMLRVYGFTEAEFFGNAVERAVAPFELSDEERAIDELTEAIAELSPRVRTAMLAKFHELLDVARLVGGREDDLVPRSVDARFRMKAAS